jgi:hypothetical protein
MINAGWLTIVGSYTTQYIEHYQDSLNCESRSKPTRISWNDGGFGTLLIRICKQIALNNMHQNMCWGNSIDLIYDLVICIVVHQDEPTRV